MQEAIAVQSTGLRWDISQFPNSDERNKMVLSDKQKAVLENDFNEKGWNVYKTWKEHSSFDCSHMEVHNLIKKNLRRLGRQSVVKEAADLLLRQQKKTRRFLRSLFVRKNVNPVPKIPTGKSHLGYESTNH